MPIFESISAGLGVYASSDTVGYTPISDENSCDDTFAIMVKGSSMFPKIEDGDSGVVKQFYQEDSETVRLHSFNPEYQDKYFIREDINRLRIVGLVKQVIKLI